MSSTSLRLKHTTLTAFSSAEVAHTQIVEQVVEVDEELTVKYLETPVLTPSIPSGSTRPSRRRPAKAISLPIVYASAPTGVGIDHLLHVAASLLPSPVEGNPPPPFTQGDQPLKTEFDATKPTIAHVFRVATDTHIGKLTCVPVHQGVVHSKSELYIDDLRKPLRIGHVMRLQGTAPGNPPIGPGEIGAVTKLDEIHFDGVLHESATTEDPPILVRTRFPNRCTDWRSN